MIDFRRMSLGVSMAFFIFLVLSYLKIFVMCWWTLLIFIFLFTVVSLLVDFLFLLYIKKSKSIMDWIKIDWRVFSNEESTQNLEYAVNILKKMKAPFVAMQGIFVYRLYIPKQLSQNFKK